MKSRGVNRIGFFSWKNLLFIFLVIILNLQIFDYLAFRITSKWHLFFSYHEGYRLPASIPAFMPFTAEVVRQKFDGHIILFTGDSTSGGLLYHHSQAIPAYLQHYLTSMGKKVKTFNLALSGAHLSEQYLLMKELEGTFSTVVFPIHYSFFSGRGPDNSFISHPDLPAFLTRVDQDDVALLDLQTKTPVESLIETLVNKVWYTYQVRRLIPYIVLGKPLPAWIRSRFYEFFTHAPSMSPETPISFDKDQPFTKQSPQMQKAILAQNVLLWQSLDYIDTTNINLLYLRKIGELKRQSGKKFYAYFVPLDMSTLTTHAIIDRQKYEQIVTSAKTVLEEFDIQYIDFNDGNPARISASDFYNPDHLLPQGNEKIGLFLAKELAYDL